MTVVPTLPSAWLMRVDQHLGGGRQVLAADHQRRAAVRLQVLRDRLRATQLPWRRPAPAPPGGRSRAQRLGEREHEAFDLGGRQRQAVVGQRRRCSSARSRRSTARLIAAGSAAPLTRRRAAKSRA